MVARSGMFVAPLAGSPPVGMSPTDGRIAFSSLIGTTPQCASGGAVSQSASTMAFTVASGVWQLPDVSNAAGTSNFLSAIDSTILTAAAGPATGSRIDLICAKQNNVENSDADSRSNLILVAGIAGAPGVAPSVPTGAYLHATITVPAVAANAAACTVVIPRPTTLGTLPVKSSTVALLGTVAGVQGQTATTADSAFGWQYYGLYNVSTNPGGARVAGWYPAAGQGPAFYAEASVGQAIVSGANTLNGTAFGTPAADLGGMSSFTAGALTVPYEGSYDAEFTCTMNATTAQVQIWVDGVQTITYSVSSTQALARGVIRCNAGSVVTFRLFAAGSGNSTANGPTQTTQVSVRYRKVRPV